MRDCTHKNEFGIYLCDMGDVITRDNISLFIYTQATVSIAVISKTNIQAFFYNELLQPLNMGRASIQVNVQTVRLVVDDIGICTQCIEYRLGDIPRTAVGAVQTNLDAFERIDAQRNQVSHVTVTACHIVHSAADVFLVGKRQFRPVLI